MWTTTSRSHRIFFKIQSSCLVLSFPHCFICEYASRSLGCLCHISVTPLPNQCSSPVSELAAACIFYDSAQVTAMATRIFRLSLSLSFHPSVCSVLVCNREYSEGALQLCHEMIIIWSNQNSRSLRKLTTHMLLTRIQGLILGMVMIKCSSASN